MTGSPLIGGWIAQGAFWILLIYGWAADEIGVSRLVTFITLWLVLWFGLPYAPAPLSGMFTPLLALVDVALVISVFKGDLKL